MGRILVWYFRRHLRNGDIMKFLRELWLHLGYWANPARYHMAEREERWKKHMLKISHMAYEWGMDLNKGQGLDNIRTYVREALKEMGYE